jgi:hypothetical protein
MVEVKKFMNVLSSNVFLDDPHSNFKTIFFIVDSFSAATSPIFTECTCLRVDKKQNLLM